MIAEIPAINVVARASKETGNVSLYHDDFLGNTGEKCAICSTRDAREPLTCVLSASGDARTPVPHLN